MRARSAARGSRFIPVSYTHLAGSRAHAPARKEHHPHPHADRAQLGRRPGGGAGLRRGRLSDQAVCYRGTAGPVSYTHLSIQPGDTLSFGDQRYAVTAVGEKVGETFSTLGHCTVRFDGAAEPVLPGTVHVKGTYPSYQIGDRITIESVSYTHLYSKRHSEGADFPLCYVI